MVKPSSSCSRGAERQGQAPAARQVGDRQRTQAERPLAHRRGEEQGQPLGGPVVDDEDRDDHELRRLGRRRDHRLDQQIGVDAERRSRREERVGERVRDHQDDGAGEDDQRRDRGTSELRAGAREVRRPPRRRRAPRPACPARAARRGRTARAGRTPSKIDRFPRTTIWMAKSDVTSRIPSSSRRLAASRSGSAVLPPTASEQGDQQRQRSRTRQQEPGRTGQVGGDQLGRLDVGEADLDDELGQHGEQGDDREYDASGEDRVPGVRGPGEHERGADHADPEADHRQRHREERTCEVDDDAGDRATRRCRQVTPPLGARPGEAAAPSCRVHRGQQGGRLRRVRRFRARRL